MSCLLMFATVAETLSGGIDSKEIQKLCSPSVVFISTPDGLGSGFVVSSDGVVVTNRHVIGEWPGGHITVQLQDGRRCRVVRVKHLDSYTELDLAILYCDMPQGVPALSIGTSTPDVGADVVAIGHPSDLRWVITKGIVSRIHDADYLQIDAAVNGGNSGGPLIDETGRVVGVITWKMRGMENTNFAIRPERLTYVLQRENVRISQERLIQSDSPTEAAWDDVRQAQRRLNEDRRQVDSLWKSLNQELIDHAAKVAASTEVIEKGESIRRQLASEKQDVEQRTALLNGERQSLNNDMAIWQKRKSDIEQEIVKLEAKRDESARRSHTSKLQGGVAMQSGYLSYPYDEYGSNHILYRGEVFLATRFGSNGDGHGADLFGVAASVMSTFGIQGVDYNGTLMNDLTMFVVFNERVWVQAGIGVTNGHPLFEHRNYLFGNIKWNWASDNYLSYGLYLNGIKDNARTEIGWGIGAFVCLNVKFLRL